jgi:hypothetical protein
MINHNKSAPDTSINHDPSIKLVLQNGTVIIHIDPNGNENLVFQFSLIFVFEMKYIWN